MNSNLYDLVVKAIQQEMGRVMPSKVTYCTLEKLEPLTFFPEGNPNIKIKESFLVVPKYRVFTKKDLGKKFVFSTNDGGQTYFYMYEPSKPQGSNGIPYSWKGNIECNIHGTCPDGAVVVTQGTIEKCTHLEAVE